MRLTDGSPWLFISGDQRTVIGNLQYAFDISYMLNAVTMKIGSRAGWNMVRLLDDDADDFMESFTNGTWDREFKSVWRSTGSPARSTR